MKLYQLPNVRAEIIRPHMPLSNWLATQKQRPFALINASLYETKNGEVLPCGTVIENGKVLVIDYKFGQHHTEYERQMKMYSAIFRRMGYADVTAVLWYVQTGMYKVI